MVGVIPSIAPNMQLTFFRLQSVPVEVGAQKNRVTPNNVGVIRGEGVKTLQ